MPNQRRRETDACASGVLPITPEIAAGAAVLNVLLLDRHVPSSGHEIMRALAIANSFMGENWLPESVTPVDIFLAIGAVTKAWGEELSAFVSGHSATSPQTMV